MKPRILDLFCGAGGAAMGYHRAGFDVVGVDIRPQPRYPFEFWQADALDLLCERAVDSCHGEVAKQVATSNRLQHGISELVGGVDITDGDFDVQVNKDRAEHGAPPLVGVGLDSTKPAWDVKNFAAIHASPPCQAHSAMSWHPQNQEAAKDLPRLIEPIRKLLQATGLPYVIENVEHAPLIDPVRICGSSVGLPIRRHRLFEANFALMVPPCAHGQQRKQFSVFRHGQTILSRVVPVYGTGGGKAANEWPEAMGIDWMTRPELAEAIPPAYTELIGHQLIQHLKVEAA